MFRWLKTSNLLTKQDQELQVTSKSIALIDRLLLERICMVQRETGVRIEGAVGSILSVTLAKANGHVQNAYTL